MFGKELLINRSHINIEIISKGTLDLIIKLIEKKWEPRNKNNEENPYSELPETNPIKKYLIKNENEYPIRSIFKSIRRYFDAFALLESPYLDLEFWESHSGYYSASFKPYKIECERLHFFAGEDESVSKLYDLLLRGYSEVEIKKELKDIEYIGYCVLRPINSCVVSRTAIKFSIFPFINEYSREFLDQEKGGIPYLKSKLNSQVNLLNSNFKLETPLFIQQDPNIGECATASLWITTHLMAEKFKTQILPYGSITKQALGRWNRELETIVRFPFTEEDVGLYSSEIRNALTAVGANTFISYGKASSKGTYETSFYRVCHKIYSFVESGFPVLLCLRGEDEKDGHVVTIVGHCLPDISQKKGKTPLEAYEIVNIKKKNYVHNHFFVSSFVDVYYVHDDAYGPFNRLRMVQDDRSRDRKIMVELGREPNKKKLQLEQVIVPKLPIIRMSAFESARFIMKRFVEKFAAKLDKGKSLNFLWRSILLRGSDFKHSLCARSYSQKLCELYSKLHLPQYIWLYEVSWRKEISDLFPSDQNVKSFSRKICGEFLIDATSTKDDPLILSERFWYFYRDYSFKSEEDMEIIEDIDFYDCYK